MKTRNRTTCLIAIGMSLLALQRSNAQLYGITDRELVIINPDTAAIVTSVGPLSLPEGLVPFNLAWHKGSNVFYALAIHDLGDGGGSDQFLVQIEKATGEAMVVADLGNTNAVGSFEVLEYVDSRDTLVSSIDSRPGGTLTRELIALTTSGGVSPLVNNGRDNDYGAYDSTRHLFYTTDPNGVGQFTEVDLDAGLNADLGSIPRTLGDLAYSPTTDACYAVLWDGNQLYRIATSDGTGRITTSLIGIVPGAQVKGLASVPEPGGPVMSIYVSCVDVCWTTRTNRFYQLQYTNALTTNQWVDLGCPIPGNGSTNCVTESVRGIEQRYYQVVELTTNRCETAGGPATR
jgi:hypothetical protein